ncbi:Dam family site-specific DNA-(adenine-N6)-methyltransferase [Bradyrhizobium sp. th.b2]|uniref:DNA adenine methylase n=1 Tax=Bradyrhizobium sp. th-b2 TaxID=172088 RepID=UPI000A028907|nr:Dam family site-specific DNA-(adenine-N6)-methyltransferase [Bradyrhizobium sp. th.b2]
MDATVGSTHDVHAQFDPFLKWAGGKRWLIQRFPDLIPSGVRNYFEPFLGSGAVYFHVRPSGGIISDLNEELVATYLALRDDPKGVQSALEKHSKQHSDDYYYEVRASKPAKPSSRAARLIYLNRTCWNGLYRVNKKGLFNVPRGTKNSVLLPSDDFKGVSAQLKSINIDCCDFETTIERADEGDFAFIDPPYTVKHNMNGFLKYNQAIFSWDDQVRLSKAIIRARERGVRLLVLNANHRSIRDLYRNVGEFVRLPRHSVLAASSDFRTETSELAITVNYQRPEAC